MSKISKADQQVVRDEKAATTREAARQAQIEKDRVVDAADLAAQAASYEPSALAAKNTFRERFMKFWRGTEI